MDESVYRVEKEDYKAFLGQLDTSKTDIQVSEQEDHTTIRIVSQASGACLCARILYPQREEVEYYIYEYPSPDERVAPKPILHVNLETKEEVQAFMSALGKMQRGEYDASI